MPTISLHPALVHVPLGLAVAMPMVAAATVAACWRGRPTRRSFRALLLLQALLVVSGVVALQGGDCDEDRVGRIVQTQVVGEHQERAELFVWAAATVLAVAAAAFALPSRALPPLSALAAAGTIAVAALAVRTGHAGGTIVDAPGGAAAHEPASASTPAALRRHPHDDD